jgi:hypothetical protein
MLGAVDGDCRPPRNFQREHRPVGVAGENRAGFGPDTSLLVQLPDRACGEVLARLAGAGRGSPSPVVRPVRTTMAAVQQHVSPAIRTVGCDNDRGPMRPLAADRLTVPGGVFPRPAEIRHNLIIAPGPTGTMNAEITKRAVSAARKQIV